MTALPAIQERFLPAPVERSSAEIAKMFATLMSAKGGDLTKAVASEYIAAVKGYPEWAIAQAGEDYRHGKRGDGKFVPLPGEFAQAVKELVDFQRKRAAEEKAVRREVESRKAREEMLASRTPEAKARVKAAYEKCKKHLAENRIEDAHDPELLADIHARTHSRFDDSARQATLKTMGQV